MYTKIRIGTRGSELALKQAEEVRQGILRTYPDIETSISVIKTTGDRLIDDPLAAYGGKGLFVKELEEALEKDEIDLAVHSMKDVPISLPRGFVIAAVTKRLDPREAFISKMYGSFKELPEGASVGTSSPRRVSQILNLRPDIKCLGLRGNIGTRLKRLMDGYCDAIILAAAGLLRLGLIEKVVEILPLDMIVPAAGQGALAVEVRADDIELGAMLKTACHHYETASAVTAERAFLETVGGDCHRPVAAYAEVDGSRLILTGLIGSPDGRGVIKERFAGGIDKPAEVGRRLGKLLLRRGL